MSDQSSQGSQSSHGEEPADAGRSADAAPSGPPLTVDLVNTTVSAQFPGSGNSCAELGVDEHGVAFAVATRVIQPPELRPGGFVSGPTQFALADAALWYLVFVAIGRVEPMALTSELSIRFLRPAIGEVMWARGTLDTAGRRNIVGTVHIWMDDRQTKPTAVAQGTYALPIRY